MTNLNLTVKSHHLPSQDSFVLSPTSDKEIYFFLQSYIYSFSQSSTFYKPAMSVKGIKHSFTHKYMHTTAVQLAFNSLQFRRQFIIQVLNQLHIIQRKKNKRIVFDSSQSILLKINILQLTVVALKVLAEQKIPAKQVTPILKCTYYIFLKLY